MATISATRYIPIEELEYDDFVLKPSIINIFMDRKGQEVSTSWFDKSPTIDALQRRVQEQYPFVSIDYFVSKANTILDNDHLQLDSDSVAKHLRHQYDLYGKKPIIFLPSDYLLRFVDDLYRLNVTFSLITVSNQPICMPYISFPPFCDEATEFLYVCDQIDALLSSPFLDKWFTKNPCIKHPKLHALPIGPKWQWLSQRFLDDDETVHAAKNIFLRFCLKPYALFHNLTHLILDDIPISDQDTFDRQDIDRAMIFDGHTLSNFIEYHHKRNPQSWLFRMDPVLFPGKDRLLYFNFFANNTDKPLYRPHANTRRLAYDTLIGQGFRPSPVRQISGYLQDLSEHKFCISPPGVGLDAHRTWEALMVGTIPIVLSSPLNPLYEGLPVIMVKSFSSISRESLDIAYEIVKANLAGYDFSKLYVDYWDQVIT